MDRGGWVLTWRSWEWSGGAGPRPGGGRGCPAAMGMGRGIICIGRAPIICPGSSMPGGIGKPGMPGPGRGMPIPATQHRLSLPKVTSYDYRCFDADTSMKVHFSSMRVGLCRKVRDCGAPLGMGGGVGPRL